MSQYCVIVEAQTPATQKTIFILKLLPHTLNDFYHRLTLWWLKEKTKFIWHELHSIVAVECKHSSILRSCQPESEEKYITLFIREEVQTSYLTMSANVVGEHFEKSVWRKFPLSFIDFFCLHTQFFWKVSWKLCHWSFTKTVYKGLRFLTYLVFWKWYRDGWPLYESQIFRHFLWFKLLFISR